MKKITLRFSTLKIVLTCLTLILTFGVKAQQSLDFQNPVIANGGPALTVGTQYRFANVTTTSGGIDVDALVTITNAQAASLTSFDDNTSVLATGISDFNPTVQLNDATIVNGSADGAFIDFRFEFVLNSDNSIPIDIEVDAYSYDVDGDGGELREYVVISSFGSYVVNNPTQLNYVGGGRFESSTVLANPGINADADFLARTDYARINTFTYRAGVLRDTGTSTTARLFGLAFQPISFTTEDVTVLSSDLVTQKSVDNTTPLENETITYTITVVNNGPDNATSVALTDVLPSGVTFSSATAVGGTVNSYDDSTGLWDIGDLNNGTTATLTIDAMVNTGTHRKTIINRTTAADSNQADPTTSGDVLSASIVPDIDSDGDTIADSADLDDDNDGILDTNEKSCVSEIIEWNTLGVSDEDAIPSGSTISTAANNVILTYTADPSLTPANGADFISYETGQLGAQTQVAQLGFDGSVNDPNARVSSIIAFDSPVTNLTFSLLDIDRDGSGSDNFVDAVEIYYSTSSGEFNVRDDISLYTLVGINVSEDDETNFHGFEGVNGNAANESTEGNIDLDFGGLEIFSIRIDYFSSDDANADPIGQGIGLSNFNYDSCELDIDGDGIPNHLDLDSDNDGCFDVVESGGNDPDNDGIIGEAPYSFDSNGQVIGTNVTGGYNGVTGNEILPIGYNNDTAIIGTVNVNEGDTFIISSDAVATQTDVWGGGPLFEPNYAAGTATDVSDDLVYTWTFDDGSGAVAVTPTESGATGQTFDFGTITASDYGEYQVTISHLNNVCISEVKTIILEPGCDNGTTLGTPTANDPDADGINNECDLDDDNDGILDTEECATNTSTVDLTGTDTQSSTGGYPVRVVGSGISGLGSGSDEFPSTYTINTTINGNDVYEGCEFRFSFDGFDDGLNLIIDGTVRLNFNQDMYDNARGANTTEFNLGIFDLDDNNEWEPWQNEGNPDLLIEDGSILLMVDSKIGRVNALPYMDSSHPNWVWDESFSLDCLSGVTFDLKNINSAGNSRMLNPVLTSDIFVCTDSDGDGIINRFELDSDGDGCFDAVESGGNDPDDDGIIGEAPYSYDSNGQVIGTNVTGGYNGVTGNEILPIGYTNDTTIDGVVSVNEGDTFIISSDAVATQTDVWNGGPLFEPNYAAGTATNVSNDLVYTWTFDDGSGAVVVTPTESGATGQTFDFGTITASEYGEYQVTITHLNNVCISEVRTVTVGPGCSNGTIVGTPTANDPDADGLNNSCDLDDDNDGILDSVEGRCDQPSVANSNSGSGSFQDQLYIFNWDGADLSNGIQNGDTQTFVLPDGLSITATFSNVSNATNASSYTPTDLNTFAGAFIHQLYNTPGTQEALLGALDAHVSFRVTFTATKAGVAFPLDIIALDGEATADPEERITFTTNGGNWRLLETINTGGNFTGEGTKVLDVEDTETSGGNSIFYSENSSTIDVDILSINGRQGVAFGLYLLCDTDNDGVPNLQDLDSDNDGIYDIDEVGTGSLDSNDDGKVDAMDTPATGDTDTDGLADAIETANGPDTGTPPIDTGSDGSFDFLNLDSDGDGCSDANEAYDDPNADGGDGGQFGTTDPATVDSNGLVNETGVDYTLGTNSNVTTAGSVSITTQPVDRNVSTGDNTSFSVIATGANLVYEWQVNTGSGFVSIDPLNGTDIYTGSDSNTLTLTNVTFADNGNLYRVLVTSNSQVCSSEISNNGLLTVDDVPLATDDTLTVDEDSLAGVSNQIDVSTNDNIGGDGGDGEDFALASGPSNGTVSEVSDGVFEYVPNSNFNGSDSFTYTLTDADGDSVTATVNVTVTSVNDAPSATDDTLTVDEDSLAGVSNQIDVSTNDNIGGDGGDGEDFALASGPSNGTVSEVSDGVFEYVPNSNFNGSDSFTYTLTDADGDSVTATVNVTVTSVNDVPLATDDTLTVDEDSLAGVSNQIDVSTNDNIGGDGGDGEDFALASGPSNGTVSEVSDGVFEYVPNSNFNGSDSFTYTLTDADGDSVTATVNVTVTSVNDVPLATDDTLTVDEDSLAGVSNQIDVSTNDNIGGDGGDGEDFALASGPSNGTVSEVSDGVFEYVPNSNFNGSDSFTYTLTDADGDSVTATVNVTVTSVNDVPLATDDTLTVDEDSLAGVSNQIDVSTNDNIGGDGGDGEDFALASGPSNGTVSEVSDGVFEYVPNSNFNGSDSFTYTLTDADGDSVTATVNVTVTSVNDAPSATDDTLTVDEDSLAGVSNQIDVSTNDNIGGDGGDGEDFALASGPSNGTVSEVSDGVFEYVPNSNFNGSDSFTYTLTDADGDSVTATVNVTVTSVNDVPLATDDTLTVDEDSLAGVSNQIDVSTNDNIGGDGGDGEDFALASGPSNGTVSEVSDGVFEYVPNSNFNGSDSFTYTLTDADGDSVTATVNVTVTSVNDVPLATDDTLTVDEDSLAGVSNQIDVSTNDNIGGDGGDGEDFALASGPSNGTVSEVSDGVFEYVPNSNFNGSDSFTYTLTDADGDSVTATVNVTVTSVNDAPSATDDTLTVDEDSLAGVSNQIDVSTNDNIGGDGGDGEDFALASGPSNGTVSEVSDGVFEYVPNSNFNGSDSFTYTLTDADGDSVTATVNVTVTSVNDVPLATDDTLTVDEDSLAGVSNQIDVSTNDNIGGDGGDGEDFALASGPSNGTVSEVSDGVFEYVPNSNFNGSDSFTYTLTDADGDSVTATVNVTVTSVNDVPLATDDTLTVDEDSLAGVSNQIDVSTNDNIGGDGGDGEDFALASGPSNGTVSEVSDGVFEYVPNSNFNGSDSFTYTLTDADGDSVTATVNVTVTSVNDVPLATDDTLTVDEDSLAGVSNQIDVSTNDNIGGDGGDGEDFALASGPSNGTVSEVSDGVFEYVPNSNFNGSDSFTYTLTDADGDSVTATVNVTVTSVNDTPLATDDTLTVDEDSLAGVSNQIDVSTNDNIGGDGGDGEDFALASGPSNGTVSEVSDGVFEYVPNSNFNGSDSFTYTLTDADGDSVTATVNVTVTSVNDVPLATDDTLTVDEDSLAGVSNQIDVSTNDNIGGDGGDGEDFALASGPSNGTVSEVSDGVFEYVPNSNFNGSDSFTYTLTDADGDSVTARVNVTVTSVNDVPLATDDTLTVDEDSLAGVSNQIDVSTNDNIGGDGGDGEDFALASGPSNGTVSEVSDGVFEYVPNSNFNGSDSFTYTLTDADGDSVTATVNVTVTSVNDVPLATDDTLTVDEDSLAGVSNQIDVSTNDNIGGDGGDGEDFALASGPSNGTVSEVSDGVFEYVPNSNFNGSDSFTYTLTDADGDSVTATVNVTVTSVNDVPLATDDTLTVDEDSLAGVSNQIDVSTNDNIGGDGGDGEDFALASGPSNGTVSEVSDGVFEYVPNSNFNGSDSFTYTLTDADGDSVTATVNVTVTSVNDVPLATDDTLTVDEDSLAGVSNQIDVSTNDNIGGDGGDGEDFALASGPSNGTVSEVSDGVFEYVPNSNFNGSDSFTYTLTDADGDSVTATVNVTVTSVNDAPLATDDTASDILEDSGLTNINIIGNDSFGGDGPSATDIVVTAIPVSVGTAVLNNGGTPNNPTDDSIDFTPALDYNGPVSITYEIEDVDGDTDTATVTFNVLSAQLTLVKTGVLSGSNLGDIITYTFTVTNTGNVTITNISIDDALTQSTGLAITPSTLAPGEQGVATATYEITQEDINTGEVINSATAIGTDSLGNGVMDVSDNGDETIDTDGDSDPTNDITVTLIEQLPNLDLVKTGVYIDVNEDGIPNAGDQVAYNFSITNNGNVTISNITLEDPLEGIVLTGAPFDLAPGETDTTTYTASYVITEWDVANGNVVNQALVRGTDPNGDEVTDLSDDPTSDSSIDQDNDGDGENETITPFGQDDGLIVYSAISANGDGSNDEFRIPGLQRYPENTLRIYNRWGVQVFAENGYEQPGSTFFTGMSTGRVTVKQEDQLPVGTYYYVLEYKNQDNKTKTKVGYVYLNR
ncbi:tandem-95 repeat protein [Aquimarina sp. W85]|uniref:tandem-95 repeat protein n=1 Tax=Aquimarina rhodophyticola TaxID=3342246 RepID=UPI00366C015C